MPDLVAIEGPLKGQTFRLGEAAVLGRSFEADLRLDDLAISRRHARISLVGGRYVIEDLGSGNGTAVNGRTIAAPTPLKNGDRIGLADNLFRFAGEPEAAAQERGHARRGAFGRRAAGARDDRREGHRRWRPPWPGG